MLSSLPSRKHCLSVVSCLLLSACATDKIEKYEEQPKPPAKSVPAGSSLGDFFGMMDAEAEIARPVMQCVKDSGSVELIEEREFSGDELMKYVPAKSKLSDSEKSCVTDREQIYAESIYAACVEYKCGRHHTSGCQAVQRHVENLVVTVVAMTECGID